MVWVRNSVQMFQIHRRNCWNLFYRRNVLVMFKEIAVFAKECKWINHSINRQPNENRQMTIPVIVFQFISKVDSGACDKPLIFILIAISNQINGAHLTKLTLNFMPSPEMKCKQSSYYFDDIFLAMCACIDGAIIAFYVFVMIFRAIEISIITNWAICQFLFQ